MPVDTNATIAQSNAMNVAEAAKKIERFRLLLLEMQRITTVVPADFEPEVGAGGELQPSRLRMNENMADAEPQASTQLEKCWESLQETVPAGFGIDGNLVRHISFNEAKDWMDISTSDIPRELIKVEEYQKLLSLVEYLDSLHPEVSRVSGIVLDGDIEAALRTVYSTLDANIRILLSVPGDQSTVPALGKAFKDGTLVPARPENTDGARAFLQGVLGFYRSVILHHPLPPWRNRLETSLSLFAVAHEAFLLLDVCSRVRKRKVE